MFDKLKQWLKVGKKRSRGIYKEKIVFLRQRNKTSPAKKRKLYRQIQQNKGI